MTRVFTCAQCGELLPVEFGVWRDDFGRLIEVIEPPPEAQLNICYRCAFAPEPAEPGRIMPTQPFIRQRIESLVAFKLRRQKALQEGGHYVPRQSSG